MLLAPVVLVLGAMAASSSTGGKLDMRRVTIPWFVLGFIAMVGVSSIGIVTPHWKALVGTVDQFLLCASLAAMGLETHFEKLRTMGARPMLLGAAAWVFIAVTSLLLIRWIY
jgi:uncharacterized membrane protein YadS